MILYSWDMHETSKPLGTKRPTWVRNVLGTKVQGKKRPTPHQMKETDIQKWEIDNALM